MFAASRSPSTDGAGLRQSRENPLGVGGEDLHDWQVHTRTFKRMQGGEGGDAGTDEDFAARGMAGIGAWILGRNMFGPIRGPWPDESWRGWWGANPPYHTAPILLGDGEHLLAGLDLPALGYRCTQCVPGAKAVHYIMART